MLIGGSCARYVLFVSQTVYQESTSHLSELVHQSDDMLNQLFSRNRMILHLWGGLLEIASSEEQIRSGMDKMQKEIDCAALYFLASDGSCMTQDGEKSSLGSQTGLGTHLSGGEDVVVNAALPGKPQMLVFVCPEAKGTYRGFAYDAVAVAYYNDTVLSAIDSSAFDGAATAMSSTRTGVLCSTAMPTATTRSITSSRSCAATPICPRKNSTR